MTLIAKKAMTFHKTPLFYKKCPYFLITFSLSLLQTHTCSSGVSQQVSQETEGLHRRQRPAAVPQTGGAQGDRN